MVNWLSKGPNSAGSAGWQATHVRASSLKMFKIFCIPRWIKKSSPAPRIASSRLKLDLSYQSLDWHIQISD
jgi:hypothetical protein